MYLDNFDLLFTLTLPLFLFTTLSLLDRLETVRFLTILEEARVLLKGDTEPMVRLSSLTLVNSVPFELYLD